MFTPDGFEPSDLRSLRYAEHFCIWALRTSVACSAQCRVLMQEFRRAFGPDDRTGPLAYYELLRCLGKGRRKVLIGRPGHIELTSDERTLIQMLAAAQADDTDRFLAHARWIMGHNHLDRLHMSAVVFTDLMRERGHFFNRPMVEDLKDVLFQASLSFPGQESVC